MAIFNSKLLVYQRVNNGIMLGSDGQLMEINGT